jgi:hypothetical protein
MRPLVTSSLVLAIGEGNCKMPNEGFGGAAENRGDYMNNGQTPPVAGRVRLRG